MTRLRTFYVLTITQMLSLIGSGMTGVAVGIRVFAETGDATPVLLAGFFAALPMMLAGSFAGVLVDRWERKRVLVWCDVGQAVGTLLLLLSFLSGVFELWHLYTIALIQGALGMLQRPAMEATVALMVPPDHLDRANVIRQMSGPAAGIIAPVLAGMLYALVGVVGVMLVDLATFVVAVVVIARSTIPQPPHESGAAPASIWAEYRSGLAFLWERRTLLFQMMFIANPLSLLITGPLVDQVLEPAVGTPAWSAVAPLVGDAPGSGMGLLMLIAGGLMFLLTALMYAHPATWCVEAEIPDHNAPIAVS